MAGFARREAPARMRVQSTMYRETSGRESPMSECEAGGCNEWVHAFDDELDVDYCCCIDADWQPIDEDTIVCGTCDLPICLNDQETKEVPGVL